MFYEVMHHGFIQCHLVESTHSSCIYKLLACENEVVMDELIPFNKPNKKLRSETMMEHLIPRTKHALSI